ncbi:hypothetical protein MNEG_7840 [Monoraphidium neglectum]|uniref:Uncharacterized protein n=1 Tax=Monoraphidium neglectum TaxID=145388 RepID=A0A0D2KY14_9CHLO|nr:hypothetical protein MNEG_7840 [Monoraphidium neglectum]KIZ00124.1 hypothetical protein MNEG_7840 [Monoraphidium neglectum]|eukprot:XP_013899143.1 hypothetical protein MNEG_7840 [Monoraphidium neglectum]
MLQPPPQAGAATISQAVPPQVLLAQQAAAAGPRQKGESKPKPQAAGTAAAKKAQLPGVLPRKPPVASRVAPAPVYSAPRTMFEPQEEEEARGPKELPPGMTLDMFMTKAQKKNLRKKASKAKGAEAGSEAGTAATEDSFGDVQSEVAAAGGGGDGGSNGGGGASGSAVHVDPASLLGGNAFVRDVSSYNRLLGLYCGDSTDDEEDGEEEEEEEDQGAALEGSDAVSVDSSSAARYSSYTPRANSFGALTAHADPRGGGGSSAAAAAAVASAGRASVSPPATPGSTYAASYAASSASGAAAGAAAGEEDFSRQMRAAMQDSESEAQARLARELQEERAALQAFERRTAAHIPMPVPVPTPAPVPVPARAPQAPTPLAAAPAPPLSPHEAVERLVARMFEAPAFAGVALRFLDSSEQARLGAAAAAAYPDLVSAIDSGDAAGFLAIVEHGGAPAFALAPPTPAVGAPAPAAPAHVQYVAPHYVGVPAAPMLAYAPATAAYGGAAAQVAGGDGDGDGDGDDLDDLLALCGIEA